LSGDTQFKAKVKDNFAQSIVFWSYSTLCSACLSETKRDLKSKNGPIKQINPSKF